MDDWDDGLGQERWGGRRHEEWDADERGPRVSYVVLIDGVVVDSWSGPAQDSPWREHPRARRWRQPLGWLRSGEPQLSAHERALAWLEGAVGGVTALADLHDRPLPDEELSLPDPATQQAGDRERVMAAAAAIDRVADRFFDSEVRTALRRAFASTVETLMLGSRPTAPGLAAAAVVYAVAKGNNLVGSGRPATLKAIAAELGLPSIPTEKGREVARQLCRSRVDRSDAPWGLHPMEPLGRADLLTARTRASFIAARDEALVAQGRLAEKELAREQARALGREQARMLAAELFVGRDAPAGGQQYASAAGPFHGVDDGVLGDPWFAPEQDPGRRDSSPRASA